MDKLRGTRADGKPNLEQRCKNLKKKVHKMYENNPSVIHVET